MNKIYGSQNQFNDIWNDFDYQTYRDGEEKDLQRRRRKPGCFSAGMNPSSLLTFVFMLIFLSNHRIENVLNE